MTQFVDRENASAFKELILPLYYIETPKLTDQFEQASDYLVKVVAEHNYQDFTNLRHRSLASHEAKGKITGLAKALMARIDRYVLLQLHSANMRARFESSHAMARRHANVAGNLENISDWVNVWLVVETSGVYHPQVLLPRDNAAFDTQVTIGRVDQDQGKEFPVHILAVTEKVTKSFGRYCQGAARQGSWPGVPKPEESRVLATTTLIRHE